MAASLAPKRCQNQKAVETCRLKAEPPSPTLPPGCTQAIQATASRHGYTQLLHWLAGRHFGCTADVLHILAHAAQIVIRLRDLWHRNDCNIHEVRSLDLAFAVMAHASISDALLPQIAHRSAVSCVSVSCALDHALQSI